MCNETDIRLVDGVTPDDGRVQICFSGLWASVCDDIWDVRDATVVCRQLGYSGCKFISVKTHMHFLVKISPSINPSAEAPCSFKYF